MKFRVDEMTDWWYEIVMKCVFNDMPDDMRARRNEQLMNRTIDKVKSWWTVENFKSWWI